MRTRNVVLSVCLALGVASCGENQTPSDPAKPGPTANSGGAVTPTPTNANFTSSKNTQTAAGVPVTPAPNDAVWTIACDTIEGPTHVAESALKKQALIAETHMPDWYVVHSEAKSDIYYGHYGDLTNKSEKKRADADRQKIASLLDSLGNPVVRGTVMIPIVTPDPVAPPEWDLRNVPKDAYWTIEWATFLNRSDRKQLAVEMVRYYREHEGMKNIYYYHGEQVSSVCVGAWKREAIAEQDNDITDITKGSKNRDDAHTQSPDTPLLVMTDIAPAQMPKRVLEPGTGREMTVEALRRDVRDPDLQAAMDKYKDHYVNGYLQGKNDRDGNFLPNPSMLVQIPHDQTAAATAITDDNWRLAGGQQPMPTNPKPQAHNGDSVLRSIGEH